MTLDKIKVKDFQSIQSGEVELGSFTVFTGPSSSGKSAFMRATQAIARNSFVPTQVSQWAKESRVSVEVDGHEIEAIRGRAKSTYVLDGEEFAKAGRSVPPQIEEIFQLPFISDLESSFATQFEKPYLIAEPGATAARVLGSLTNVSVLHGGLKEVNRRSLEARSLLKTRTKDLEDTEERLKDFSEVPWYRNEVDQITESVEDLDEQHQDLNRLTLLLHTIENLDNQLEEIEIHDVSEAVEKFEDLTSDVDTLGKLHILLTTSESLARSLPKFPHKELESIHHDFASQYEKVGYLKNLQTLLREFQRLEDQLPDWDVDAVPSSEDIQEVDTLVDSMSRLRTATSKVEEGLRTFKELTSELEEVESKVSELHKEYDTILDGYDTCPLCNGPIKGESH